MIPRRRYVLEIRNYTAFCNTYRWWCERGLVVLKIQMVHELMTKPAKLMKNKNYERKMNIETSSQFFFLLASIRIESMAKSKRLWAIGDIAFQSTSSKWKKDDKREKLNESHFKLRRESHSSSSETRIFATRQRSIACAATPYYSQ